MTSIISIILFSLLQNTTPKEIKSIGIKIFANECDSRKELLVYWDKHEEFPSLGTGHFIWYPTGYKQIFSESFPGLVKFYEKKCVNIPDFVKENINTGCPWKSKDEMDTSKDKQMMIEWLFDSIEVQTEYILQKATVSLTEILEHCENENLTEVSEKIRQLSETTEGKFALVDYLNFKGTGLDTSEQYNGTGWGLLQVLKGMTKPGVKAFSVSAAQVLRNRVVNSPESRNEKVFLKGWLKRVKSYCI